MTVVRANELDFDVLDVGAGEPVFVFIHGLACDASAWQPQVDDLSRDHRCVAISLRGRGQTPAAGPFDVEQQAADVAAVLDVLGIASAAVVGHSLGGLVALLLNALRPGLVRAILIADSPVGPRGFDGAALAGRILEAGTTGPLEPLLESFWAEATSPETRERVRNMMLGCPHEVAAGMLSTPVPPHRLAELVALADKKPFMAIWAGRPLGDPVWLRDRAMFIRQEPVAGAGHFVQLEKPAVTNALLRAFLDDIERDPRPQA
ncbi:MAG: alpha/beta fold hydrolase [Dehalococcoidia bacterium]|nr:alpha/beta fold hydrolase [Dehalococcoidia bacterium]MCB9485387.1 alpha/beta fold hydrolase [Thermoflexaceae bacterium]